MNVMAPPPHTSSKVAEIKRLVELGCYQVDPYAVAEAMIRRAESEFGATDGRELDADGQNECSYPDSSLSASVNATPAGPSTTAPIHVKASLAFGQAA